MGKDKLRICASDSREFYNITQAELGTYLITRDRSTLFRARAAGENAISVFRNLSMENEIVDCEALLAMIKEKEDLL